MYRTGDRTDRGGLFLKKKQVCHMAGGGGGKRYPVVTWRVAQSHHPTIYFNSPVTVSWAGCDTMTLSGVGFFQPSEDFFLTLQIPIFLDTTHLYVYIVQCAPDCVCSV